MNKLISIIIVNWNGEKWLSKCLSSLAQQTYKQFEIIFVDNGSKDNSVAYVKKNFPHVKIILNKKNLGFAGGNNVGYKHAKGEYILLLNNDTWVEKNFLKKIIGAFDRNPRLGSVQPKIVLMDDPKKLDAVGAYWTDSSFLYYYGFGKNSQEKKYNKKMPFFSNKGAAMLFKKELVDKIGLFDDDFWCYYEETDFCHRVWLAGYECWYYPDAVVHHAMGGTSLRFDSSFVQFHNFKNKLLSFLKNFEAKNLITIVPIYILLNIFISFIWLFQGKYKHFLALYRSIGWNISHAQETSRKRKIVQSLRTKSDDDIFKMIKVNPRLPYYLYLFKGELDKFPDKNK